MRSGPPHALVSKDGCDIITEKHNRLGPTQAEMVLPLKENDDA
jgi:hypothetical protein